MLVIHIDQCLLFTVISKAMRHWIRQKKTILSVITSEIQLLFNPKISIRIKILVYQWLDISSGTRWTTIQKKFLYISRTMLQRRRMKQIKSVFVLLSLVDDRKDSREDDFSPIICFHHFCTFSKIMLKKKRKKVDLLASSQ